jgi:type II secretory pathway pseudopilin PulG
MRTLKPFRLARCAERGSMLIELLISMTILAVGLGALMVLLVGTMHTNGRASKDTTSTMIAEHVIEQISAQPADGTALLTIRDCTGTDWNIATAGAPQSAGSGGSYGGNGARIGANGIVDWSQDYSGVPVNYKMRYVACGAGGRQTTFDVRWDVITMSNANPSYSRMIVVSARPMGSTAVGGLRFVVPAQLRTVAGM